MNNTTYFPPAEFRPAWFKDSATLFGGCLKKGLVLLTVLLASMEAGLGQSLTVTISPQTKTAIRGDVVTYQGTIGNNGAAPVYLNGDSIFSTLHGFQILPVTFDLHLDDAPFVTGAPVILNPGQSWSGNLFQVTVGIDAPATTYDGSFSVLGGAGAAPFNPVGNATFHLTVLGPSVPGGPAAPSNLRAMPAGSNIALAWTDHASNEEGFSIERSTDGSTFSVIALVGADQVQYVFGTPNPAAVYFFRVRAFNSFNTLTYSAYTNIAVAQTAPPPATLVPWNAPDWAYMCPMGGAAGTLPNRADNTPDPNFYTTWYLPQSVFPAQYDGPAFGASPALTGTPGNAATYDSGTGAGPLGFSVMDYWATAGAEFTAFATVLTTPTSGQRWTGYFRKTFTVPVGGELKPTFRYLIDDGAYIYLDGVLIATVNIPADPSDATKPIADTFTQLTTVAGNEGALQTIDLSLPAGDVPNTNAHIWAPQPSLSAGTHTLAVSVHQTATTSSDLGLSLELSAQPGQQVFAVATDASAQVATNDTGEISIVRTGDTSAPLVVGFTLAGGAGQAAPGIRYMLTPGGSAVTIPLGETSTTVIVNPLADMAVLGTQSVTLNLAAGSGYDIGAPSSASVQLFDSPFNVWKIQEFGSLAAAQSPSAADTATPAGDGLTNLLKYSLGLAPLVPAANSAPVGAVEDFSGTTHLTLTFTRPHPAPGDITYHVEFSSDLPGGVWTPAPLVPGYPVINGALETFKAEDPDPSAGKTKDFIRLRVTRP